MKLPSVLFLLYGAALIFIVYFMMTRNTSTVYIQREAPVVYPEAVYTDSSWWPWSVGTYNYFPYWTGYWNGGGDGGYGYWRGGRRGGHGGGHYGPIGTPASRPGGGFGGGRPGGMAGHGGGGHSGGGRR